MLFEYKIEVISSDPSNKKIKGDLLENLCEKVLKIMQYDVEKEVRKEGMEVDLIAIHKVSKEKIYIECKAHRQNISSSVIRQLMGNLVFEKIESGWLFTTAPLGKDSKALKIKVEEGEVDYKISFYTSDKIVDLLISSSVIINPETIKLKDDLKISDSLTLLVSEFGLFWALPIIHSGIISSVAVFNANSGKQVVDDNLIKKISETDTEFKELQWIIDDLVNNNVNRESYLQEYKENIIQISPGDAWADYRPSRPQDFVGRDKLIKNTFEFFDKVISCNTKTRLISFSSPSGWGKSSILLKLIDNSQKKHNRNKYYVHAVDVRAAISSRYAEFALKECINAAIKDQFVKGIKDEIIITNLNSPFESKNAKELLKYLKENNKVIVLFFDQFEEILSKKELYSLFDNIKKLSIAIDSLKENIVLGFAWKTDFLIPVENGAYNMWQNMSDRKLNFDLMPFNEKDINKALKLFSKEIEGNIDSILKKYLVDQCQGYPWLLKKLCIYIYDSIENGSSNIIDRNLDIKELFEKDLRQLNTNEDLCIREIGKETPANFYLIAEKFGEQTIQSLISKRLILRKGPKLILYWDIFRDYVVNDVVPTININYIPKTNFNTYNKTLDILIDKKSLNIDELATELNMKKKAVYNILSDLVIIGNIERNEEKIKSLDKNKYDAFNKIYEFLHNHILVKKLLDEYSISNKEVSVEEFTQIFYTVYNDKSLKSATKEVYLKRIITWLISLNIIEIKNNNIIYLANKNVEKSLTLIKVNPHTKRSKQVLFLGQTSYNNVIELLKILNKKEYSIDNLLEKKYRNSINVLDALGLLEYGKIGLKSSIKDEQIERILYKKLKENQTIRYLIEFDNQNKEMNYITIGEYIGGRLGKQWKETSKTRNGRALIKWYEYFKTLSVRFE